MEVFTCFECGDPVCKNPRWVYINGVKRHFHSSVMKDCLNNWNKKRDEEIRVAKQRTITNVVLQHGGAT